MFIFVKGAIIGLFLLLVKPSSPKDLAFRWHQEAVTVTCPDLLYKDLLYEMQFKSIFDTEWQVSGVVSSQGRCDHPQGANCGETDRQTQRQD